MVIAIVTGALYNSGQGMSSDRGRTDNPEKQTHRRPKMSFVRKNKTFLFIPVAFSVLIVIGILVS